MPDGGNAIIDVLDDFLANGGDIPPNVTNRMLLKALRANYQMSLRNHEQILENNECVRALIFGDDKKPGIEPRLKTVEEHQASQARLTWLVVGVVAAAIADIVVHLVI